MERVIQSYDLHDFFKLLDILDVKLLDTRPKPVPLLWINAPRADCSIWLVANNFWRKHTKWDLGLETTRFKARGDAYVDGFGKY